MVAPIGYLGPNIKWYVNNKCGVAAVGGRFETSSSITGAPQPTYNSAFVDITTQNPNPMLIASDGATTFPVYFAEGDGYDPYTIKEFDAAGNLITETNNYLPTSGAGGGGTINISVNTSNYGRNEQFSFWNFGTDFTNDLLPSGTTQIANDWYFTRTNQTANVEIARYTFPAGSPNYPFSPAFALRYTVSSAAGDSKNDISQTYESVQTLNNKQVTIVMRGQSLQVGQSASVSLIVTQNFGTGGSLPVETPIATYTFDDTEDAYSTTFTVPTIGGKTIGTAGDDYLQISYRFNPSQTQSLIMTCYQFQNGSGTGIFFPYETENDQYVRILPDVLKGHSPNTGTDIIGTGSITTPAAQNETLTQYLQTSFFESGSPNILIGWNFPTNPNQNAEIVTGVADGSYVADQTIVISDGNGVVSKVSEFGQNLELEVAIANKKFGIFQIIETANSTSIGGTLVSLAALIQSSTASTSKMAVIGWNGTVNQQTRDPVLTWNSAGSDPTLATNWTYLATPLSFSTSSSTSHAVMEAIDTMAANTFNSFGVMVWCDAADIAVNGLWVANDVSLVIGQNACVAQKLDIQTVLAQCQRYYQRSYPINTPTLALTEGSSPGVTPTQVSGPNSSGTNPIFPVSLSGGGSLVVRLTASSERVNFQTEMWMPPSVIIYNSNEVASGTGYWNLDSTIAPTSGSLFVNLEANSINQRGFSLYNTDGEVVFSSVTVTVNNASPVNFNYVADAQLGV